MVAMHAHTRCSHLASLLYSFLSNRTYARNLIARCPYIGLRVPPECLGVVETYLYIIRLAVSPSQPPSTHVVNV